VLGTDITGRLAWMGGLRMDITVRDEHGRHTHARLHPRLQRVA
jgi:hypothetical protein